MVSNETKASDTDVNSENEVKIDEELFWIAIVFFENKYTRIS